VNKIANRTFRANGIVGIRRDNEGYLEETFIIRKLQPYKGPPVDQINMNEHEDATNLFVQQSNEFASYIMNCSS